MGSDLDILTIYFTDVKRRGMARPLRLQFPGATYHVISRGNNREPIFLKDSDRLKFLELLGRLTERFDTRIYAYCLMRNQRLC